MPQKIEEKQKEVVRLFQNLTQTEKYQKIIELGKKQKPFPEELRIAENLVKGCQSIMYLSTYEKEGKLYFQTFSDALISAGLATLLVEVYSGETPETILKKPPSYIEECGIISGLTPNRANGLYSIHLRMKQEALKYLLRQEKPKN